MIVERSLARTIKTGQKPSYCTFFDLRPALLDSLLRWWVVFSFGWQFKANVQSIEYPLLGAVFGHSCLKFWPTF